MALTRLSTVVDHALAVIDEYQRRILKLEQAVLLKPSMKIVRQRKCRSIKTKVVAKTEY